VSGVRPRRGPALTWEQRLLDSIPLHPGFAAFCVTAVVFLSYVAFSGVVGTPIVNRDLEFALPVDPGAWSAMVESLLMGYGLLVTHYAIAGNAEDMAALEPLVRGRTAADLRDSWSRDVAGSVGGRRVAEAVGLVTGLALWGITAWRLLDRMNPADALLTSSWFMVITPLLLCLLARAFFFTALGLRGLSQLADDEMEIDLLDPTPLERFALIGLRNSLAWIVASTLTSLLFLNIPVQALVQLFPLLLAIFALAVAALAVPLRRARRVVVRAKRGELRRINAEIRECSGALLAGDAGVAATRLPGLIAYRDLVEEVREYPLDTRILTRFLLYLTIPVLGWVGGALVERLVDAVLD
jgi:hypothetical protein